MLTFLMSQGGKVEKSGGFPSPQVQTEMEPSAHSGAERLWTEVAKERRSRGARSNILRNWFLLQPQTCLQHNFIMKPHFRHHAEESLCCVN